MRILKFLDMSYEGLSLSRIASKKAFTVISNNFQSQLFNALSLVFHFIRLLLLNEFYFVAALIKSRNKIIDWIF